MIKTNNNQLLTRLTSIRECDWWLMCYLSIWCHFSAEVSQKHLIETSDQPDEEADIKITYSLSWLMVINDRVRLADRLKGKLSSFEWLLKMCCRVTSGCIWQNEKSRKWKSGLQPSVTWEEEPNDLTAHRDTSTKAEAQCTTLSYHVCAGKYKCLNGQCR